MGRKRSWSGEAMELIADKTTDINVDARKGVLAYRVETIKHGPMVDVKCYPIWSHMTNWQTAKRIRKESTKAQRMLNLRRSMDTVTYLANENFSEDDVMLTLTSFRVDGDDQDAAAKRTITSFVKKLRREWAKRDRELKYIYTLERTDSPIYGRRYHLHILLNAHAYDRDWLESLWTKSACNTRRYQDQAEHMGGFAGYLKKPKEGQEKAGFRAWACSRNLKRPQPTVSTHKISIRKMERIAHAMEQEAREIVETVYPGYKCTRDVVTRRSDFVPGVYMYARLRRQNAESKMRSMRR